MGRSNEGKQDPLRVAIIGAPGTGKSTYAFGVTFALKKLGYKADYVREVSRAQAEKIGHFPVNITEQWPIFSRQLRREIEVGKMHDIVVSDCATFMCGCYGSNFIRNITGELPLPGQAIDGERWHQFLDIFDDAALTVDRYDLYFLPPIGIFEFDPTTRLQKNRAESDRMDRKIRAVLDLTDTPYTQLGDNPDLWVDQIVDRVVGEYARKFPESPQNRADFVPAELLAETSSNKSDFDCMREKLREISDESRVVRNDKSLRRVVFPAQPRQ